MIPHDRRSFLRNLALGGAAVFTARHLRLIEADAAEPRYPGYVGGPYRKSWETLYAELGEDGYRLTTGGFASEFDTMTWWQVLDCNGNDEYVEVLQRLDELGLDGQWYDALDSECEDDAMLAKFSAAGGEAEEGAPTWGEVWDKLEPETSDFIRDNSCNGPRSLAELDEACDDWYDRVGPMSSPEGEAYQEVIELLRSVEREGEEFAEALRGCLTIIEGSAPGNDFHGVFVNSLEDLGILRRLLHVTGHKVNIKVGSAP